MTDNTPPQEPENQCTPSLTVVRVIESRLKEFVGREEKTDYQGVRDSQRTFLIGRVSLILSGLLTLPVAYLIFTLVRDMGKVTRHMDQMNTEVVTMRRHFDEVARIVGQLDTSMLNMSRAIAVLPPMERRLAGMRGDFDIITAAMNGGITPNVTTIDDILGVMDRDMAEMNQAFGFVNRDVFFMRHNVHQMSSPLRMMPFFGR